MGYTLELVKSSERQFYLKEKSRGFRTIFVADSFTDVPGLKVVDFGVVPANGHSLAKKSSDLVLKSKGGDGAVAEVCLLIWGLLNK
jgi:3-deoxy-D-manno-octulosonate 8-phosphate phosphatase KdsC-like HAD superfamily phosphatase